MAALTYSTLIDAVESRLDRTDLTDLIPSFITRTEEEINTRIARWIRSGNPLRPAQKICTLTLADSSATLPDSFIDAIRVHVSDGTNSWVLARLSAADLNQDGFYATRALPYREGYNSSREQYYYTAGTGIYLPGVPDDSLAVTMHYYGKPDALSTANGTNWLIENHSNVYEFGTLAHACRHIRDDAELQQNISLFEAAVDGMLNAYPEYMPPTERRATDAPWSSERWSITNG